MPQYGFDEDLGFGAVLVNALVFIGIGAGSAFVLILIVRKKGINALERVMIVAFLILGTFILYLYIYNAFVILSLPAFPVDDPIDPRSEAWYNGWSMPWLIISFGISLFLVYLFASKKYNNSLRIHNIVVVIEGILIGSYLPIVIPTWTAILILIGFSLYDIYSVRKGPIKEMMTKMDPDNAVPFSGPIDVKDMTIDIGIGDLAFYSMLTSITLISTDWGGPALVAATGNMFLYLIPFAATVVGVLIGVWISFELVKKNKILPGLPMSVFIGLGLMSLAIVICAAIF